MFCLIFLFKNSLKCLCLRLLSFFFRRFLARNVNSKTTVFICNGFWRYVHIFVSIACKMKNIFIIRFFFWYFFLLFQQIQEKEARNVCHTYKCLLKKKKKNGNEWKKREHENDFNVLPVTVADAAKKLCRSILRYEGNPVLFHFVP